MSGWMKYPFQKECVDCEYYNPNKYDAIVKHPHLDCRSMHTDCPGKLEKLEREVERLEGK